MTSGRERAPARCHDIRDKLKVALADELLFGKLQRGVDLHDGEIVVEVIKSREAPVDEE